MKKLTFILLLIFYCFAFKVNGQTGFRFLDANRSQESISFKLINNIIVIPIEINGKKLSFIVDTGVNKTILFNLSNNDSLNLKNVKKVKLQGLGSGEAIDALLSNKNRFKIAGLESESEEFYVILKEFFNLSSKMGMTIHGIIGHNLFKDLIVKINYKTKRINFYDPKKFKYRKCRKCEVFPIQFYRKKPYIDVKIQLDTIGNKLTDVKMLVDSGGTDAIWLFENSKEEIKTPKLFFNDILGEGLSGTIFGNRSRVPKLKLGRFNIEKPTVSFLDSISTYNARKFKERNGSIGSGILKRFKVWIDYPNKKITFKKNGSLKKGFNYNMSGLDVVYDGKQLVRERVKEVFSDSYGSNIEDKHSISFITRYAYNFKSSYVINRVVKNSASYRAGLLRNDILLKINGEPTHKLSLNDITNKLQEGDNRKIKLLIERDGVQMKFEFRLEKRI